MNRFKVATGDWVILRAKVNGPALDGQVDIETSDGSIVRIHRDMIIGIDRQEVTEKSVVRSTLPSRIGLKGVVLKIDGGDAFVRWVGDSASSEGRATVEKLTTLFMAHMNPS